MTRLGKLMIVVALGSATCAANQRSEPPVPEASTGLPAGLETYREWSQLIKEPHPVGPQLWARCLPAPPEEVAQVRAQYGPHVDMLIRVYGNRAAADARANGSRGPFPVGAVLVKEKVRGARTTFDTRSAPSFPVVDGIGFMIKREAARFPNTGGWEFGYRPDPGDGRRTHEACAACHRTVATADFVFGQYPR